MVAIECSSHPDIHRACSRIANRVVFLMRPLIRSGGDRDFALREAYAIAREEMERHESAIAPGELVHNDRPKGATNRAAGDLSHLGD